VSAKQIEIEFIGTMDFGGHRMPLWNILEPIKDHPAGSTLSSQTLIGLGVLVPVADARFISHFHRVPFSVYWVPGACVSFKEALI
jgi:hypothetical protein